MELNIKKVEQMRSEEIFESLLSMIDNIFKQFGYMELPKQEYYKLVKKEICNSKKTYNGNTSYTEFIAKRIKSSLSEETRKLIHDSASSFRVIDNYVRQNFGSISSCEDAERYFEELNIFFENHEWIPNPDLLIQLINKNDNFNKMIEQIVEQYYEGITKGNAEKIFDNNLLVLTVEMYCMLKNIEIKEEKFEVEIYDESDDGIIDSFKIYLKEVGRKPLLSIEEERKLANKISKGDVQAREQFIESNLRLVISIAKYYLNRGLSFLDLIQEGNQGLIVAVDKYNVEKGYKFATYASHWIRQAITRAIADKGSNVRLPVYMYERIGKYNRTVITLKEKLNREPTINEIAMEMDLSNLQVSKLQKIENDQSIVSVNTLVGEDKDTELGNLILVAHETLEETTIYKMLQEDVKKLVENCNLTEREKEILKNIYGFNNQEPMSLSELGEIYGITRERVRQIKKKALEKIRRSKYAKDFTTYMDDPVKALENLNNFREEAYKTYKKK